MAKRCTEVESGARNVDNILTNTLLPEISRRILAGLAEGQKLRRSRCRSARTVSSCTLRIRTWETLHNRVDSIRIYTTLGDDVLVPRSFDGSEGISRLYEYRVDLASESATINATDIVGKRATLSILQSDMEIERYFDGFVSHFTSCRGVLRTTHLRVRAHARPMDVVSNAHHQLPHLSGDERPAGDRADLSGFGIH